MEYFKLRQRIDEMADTGPNIRFLKAMSSQLETLRQINRCAHPDPLALSRRCQAKLAWYWDHYGPTNEGEEQGLQGDRGDR